MHRKKFIIDVGKAFTSTVIAGNIFLSCTKRDAISLEGDEKVSYVLDGIYWVQDNQIIIPSASLIPVRRVIKAYKIIGAKPEYTSRQRQKRAGKIAYNERKKTNNLFSVMTYDQTAHLDISKLSGKANKKFTPIVITEEKYQKMINQI